MMQGIEPSRSDHKQSFYVCAIQVLGMYKFMAGLQKGGMFLHYTGCICRAVIAFSPILTDVAECLPIASLRLW